MRFAWYLGAILLAGAAAPAGCGSSDDFGESSFGSSGVGGGGGDSQDRTITLDADRTVDLAPGEVFTVRATVKPAGGSARVAFALVGDPADASLEATIVAAGGDGVAETKLHAPSVPSTFLLRATLVGESDAFDSVAVAVSKKGFATLEIGPQYGGLRNVDGWVATAVTRTTCAALASTLPKVPPGGLEATGEPKHAISLSDVPVGPPVAVVVRAGHFAWGCADSPALAPNQKTKLGVTVVDKPLDLATAKLDFTLEFQPDPTELGALAADGLAIVDAAVFGQDQDPAFVLDLMQRLAQPGFEAARSTYGWDGIVSSHLAMNGTNLRADVESWVYAGIAAQPATMDVKVAGDAADAKNQVAELTVRHLGSFTAAQAGLAKKTQINFSADTSDVVTLSGKIDWAPSAFIASSALVGATVAYPGATSVPAALAADVDCQGLGSALGGYENCDATCLGNLCAEALTTAWEAASMASASSDGKLELTINGTAKVDDHASPSSVQGQWIGLLHDAVVQASVKGAATATKTGSHPTP